MASIARTFSLNSKPCCNSALSVSDNCEIAIATESGIQILDFGRDPVHGVGQFSFVATRIPLHPQAYIPDVGISRDTALQCYEFANSEDAVNILHDRTLSHRSPSGQGYKLSHWSPLGMDDIKRCVLVTLNLHHRLSLFSRRQSDNSWTEMICLSDILFDYMKSSHFKTTKSQSRGNDASLYIKRMYSVSVTAFSWSPHLYSKLSSKDDESSVIQYAYLASATKTGHVIFWVINSPVSASAAQIETVIELPDGTIVSALCWCTDSTNSGYLVLGCVNGHIYKISLQHYTVTELWTQKDDIRVTHIIWLSKLNMIVASKGTYIFMMKLCDDLDCQSAGVKCVSDKLPITGLVQSGDNMIYLSTGNSLFQTGQISVMDSGAVPSIELEELLIQRESVTLMANYGLTISPNRMFIATAESPAEIYYHLRIKDPLKLHIINISTPADVTNILFDSSLTSLQGLVDVLISMKYHLSKLQPWPEVDQFIQLMNSRQELWHRSVIQLKVLRYLLQIWLQRNDSAEAEVLIKSLLEETSLTLMKKHLNGLLKDLVERQLSVTERQIASVSCSLLRKFDNNTQETMALLDLMEKQISSEAKSFMPESCPICRTCITDYTIFMACCPKGHKFSRCSQTLLLCHHVPYRVCGWCKMVYICKQKEECSSWLQNLQNDYCIFCDQNLFFCL